jgi:creatinine amidohydrolase/Fe(II)-dependent formamide hydrolase-like protein
VILPGGVLEEHGPYLPAFTDGYLNERWAREIADAVAARPGWTALVFPMLPLGVGGANELGGRMSFPGSFGVREATLRAVYLDLATQLGEQGFRWLFVVQNHGSPLHLRAIDAAADYFGAEFGGTMVNLAGVALPPDLGAQVEREAAHPLTAAQRAENGIDAHAGWSETSRMLWVRPDLVRPDYRSARTLAGGTLAELVTLARDAAWPGYFGAPRLATAAAGAVEMRRRGYAALALRILDGLDPARLAREADLALADAAEAAVARSSEARDRAIAERQARHDRPQRPPRAPE